MDKTITKIFKHSTVRKRCNFIVWRQYQIEFFKEVKGNFYIGNFISDDSYMSLIYAEAVIKNRFKLGEPKILNHERFGGIYISHLRNVGLDNSIVDHLEETYEAQHEFLFGLPLETAF